VLKEFPPEEMREIRLNALDLFATWDGPPFYRIRFADSKVAADQVKVLLSTESLIKLRHALDRPPKPEAEIIVSLVNLETELRTMVQPRDLNVSTYIKTYLESEGIEFTVLALLRKPG
jgi:hypothetical protein